MAFYQSSYFSWVDLLKGVQFVFYCQLFLILYASLLAVLNILAKGRDVYAGGGGQEGQLPLCPHSWGQEGQELPFKLSSFHLFNLLKVPFPAL